MEFNEPRGIYLQIADQICVRILQKEWNVNERIPSIRELAVELAVNPNTVTKSYQVLLDREVIINQRGKGYFVSAGAAAKVLSLMKTEFIQEELPRLVRAMNVLGIDIKELENYLRQIDSTQSGKNNP